MYASEGKILFRVVREAVKTASITLNVDNPQALLVWFDTIKDDDYFTNLQPWQVVNRLPSINLICRKAPFVRMIQRISMFAPDYFQFLPKSFILPLQKTEFLEELNKNSTKKFLVKPDGGSLGSGITIITPNQKYNPTENLSIAQEYVESYLIDKRKFDLRIYVLIASITPLRIYVFRNGVARFCSEESGSNSVYSQLTNTAVNKKNANGDLSQITKMVADVFEGMKEKGVDIDNLWQKIDDAIVFTILASYSYLVNGQERQCKPSIYSRCFQILGFDVLLDQNLNPHILEVNYRPSLDTDTNDEYKMKVIMLSEAMKIAVPLESVQNFVSDDKMEYSHDEWKEFLESKPNLKIQINKARQTAEKNSHFAQVYPSAKPSKNKQYLEVIDKVRHLPTDIQTIFRLPGMPEPNALDRYYATLQKKASQKPSSIKTRALISKDIKDNRTKAASRMTINKYVGKLANQSRNHSSLADKIVLPQPRQVSNTISFSLQMEVDDNSSSELPSLQPKNQPKLNINSKKAIRKPVMKKTVVMK
ncbi:Tubulin-tyrosine ligase family protein [Tritrichomonas foetus]|uniref:Tubulin-tyrosine ligase family protein n=1 Tax=Tritrichomonas foetus TaxID=1144522 RepID=A0A1J4JUG5_9EUKA|nr:Tubulin-tyrosine ligase family protein [Tritrichomonas foetus]|eukprot:OHT02785.1 Tubulin-tyrosine ligase family protein [Tritrichomonas foetus]